MEDINCNSDPKFTGSLDRVIEDDLETKAGGWYDETKNMGWGAAPLEFPFGTKFYIIMKGGIVVVIEKHDNGGGIVTTVEDVIGLDVMYDDGKRYGDQGYNGPRTSDGQSILGTQQGFHDYDGN